MEINPYISIIIATYNSEKTLENTLNSILNQNYSEYELIIVDGNSNDNTLKIIEKFTSQIAYVLSEKDFGIYDAWNKGLKFARGQWICFIGSDDIFIDTNCLQLFSQFLVNVNIGEHRIVYPSIKIFNKIIDQFATVGENWNLARKLFFKFQNIPHVGMMHHKTLFIEYGKFDSRYKIAGDYEFLLRVIRQKNVPLHYSRILFIMGNEGLSNNPNYQLKILQEVFFAKVKNKIWPFYYGGFKILIFQFYLKIKKSF